MAEYIPYPAKTVVIAGTTRVPIAADPRAIPVPYVRPQTIPLATAPSKAAPLSPLIPFGTIFLAHLKAFPIRPFQKIVFTTLSYFVPPSS